MNEFELIDHAFRWKLPYQHPMTRLPGGDDASVHAIPDGLELVVSADMSLAGVHWPHDFPLDQAAARAVNAALSDLAAMGAKAGWVWCCAAVQDEIAAEQMGDGVASALAGSDIELAGGDTVHAEGHNSLAVTVAGLLPKGSAMRRDQAVPGDDIWLCGELGIAAHALRRWQQGDRSQAVVQAFGQVRPLLAEGVVLREAGVRCCIDVSDGLLADAGHIASSSDVGMEIDLSSIPSFAELSRHMGVEDATHLVLAGGEDYALVCTAPETLRDTLSRIAVRIGRCISGNGVRAMLDGSDVPIRQRGYDHFG